MGDRQKRAERYLRRVARRRQEKMRANAQRMLLIGVAAYLAYMVLAIVYLTT